jgi:hypothetical protein
MLSGAARKGRSDVDDPHPPVRELLDFEGLDVVNGFAGGQVMVVRGTQPDHWQVALEDDPDPSIPEREWVPWHLVGYHFGEFVPSVEPYRVARQIPGAPPGAVGIEVVGKTTRRQVRLW